MKTNKKPNSRLSKSLTFFLIFFAMSMYSCETVVEPSHLDKSQSNNTIANGCEYWNLVNNTGKTLYITYQKCDLSYETLDLVSDGKVFTMMVNGVDSKGSANIKGLHPLPSDKVGLYPVGEIPDVLITYGGKINN